MKTIQTLGVLLCVPHGTCAAQVDASYRESRPAQTNAPGLGYPRVDSRNRVTFRVEAPDARQVQVDLLKVYDMVRDEAGVWTVTTDSLPPGFHYCYLMVDGYRFSDPASESFFGIGRMMSGIEIPAPDQAFYTPKNIPHGQVREVYHYSKVTDGYQRGRHRAGDRHLAA